MLRSRHRRRQFGQSHQVAAAMVVSAHRRLRAIPQFPFATYRFHPSEGVFHPLLILLTDQVAIVGGVVSQPPWSEPSPGGRSVYRAGKLFSDAQASSIPVAEAVSRPR